MFFLVSSLLVCNTGHYSTGNDCVVCPGNTIKSMIGDAMNCNDDELCDGVNKVPNTNHTTCG